MIEKVLFLLQMGTHSFPDLEATTTFNAVAMDDIEGINQICEEIAETRLALIREDEGLEKNSLMPYLVLPALGIVGLCLILSETRFQKIP